MVVCKKRPCPRCHYLTVDGSGRCAKCEIVTVGEMRSIGQQLYLNLHYFREPATLPSRRNYQGSCRDDV